MRTVLNMLAPDANTDKECVKAYIKEKGIQNVSENSFEVLDVIDPSFLTTAITSLNWCWVACIFR